MDKLEEMFNRQTKLQIKLDNIRKIESSESNKQQYINQMLLSLFEESVEIMRETGYKNPNYVPFGWKQTQEWNVENYKEEIIDLFHYVMNLCIAVNMEANEFFEIYCKKNGINHERQENPDLGYIKE